MDSTQRKPLDLEIFKKFTFVNNVGNYHEKKVCIMSALRLATAVAAGEIKLKDAIMSEEQRFEIPYAERPEDIAPSDRVECVDEVIRSIAIERNDCTEDRKERKEWALLWMPRLVGTYCGKSFSRKLMKASNIKINTWLGNYRLVLQSQLDSHGPRTKKGKSIRDQLAKIAELIDPDEDGKSPGEVYTSELDGTGLDLAYLDARLDATVTMAHSERARLDAIAEQKAAEKLQAKNTPDPSIGA